jgi:hypothetical protein
MRSIELTFDTALESAIRAEWAALESAGLPNLGRHPHDSNRPHLTLAAGAELAATDAVRAVFGRRDECLTAGSPGAASPGTASSGTASSGTASSGKASPGTAPHGAARPAAAQPGGSPTDNPTGTALPDTESPADTLPIDLVVSGFLLFPAGTARFVLVRPVVVTAALLALHRTVHERAPGAVDLTRPGRWTPHVTLARRLSAAQVAEALDVLGAGPPPGSGVAARFWNGDSKTLTPLTPLTGAAD